MITLLKIGNSSNVPFREYLCDVEVDVQTLPINVPMGSCAKVIATGNSYIYGSNGWVKKINNNVVNIKNSGGIGSLQTAVRNDKNNFVGLDGIIYDLTNPIANANESVVLNGYGYIESGSKLSTVMGNKNVIKGNSSAAVAEGDTNLINGGNYSHVEGFQNIIQSGYSHAEGANNQIAITAARSHVEGQENIVHGNLSHVEGYINIINSSASISHIEGSNNLIAIGVSSHAEGGNNLISSSYSHIEGFSNAISKDRSHVEGLWNSNSGTQTHIEGYLNFANNGDAHVEGSSNAAFGYASHVEGTHNIVGGGNIIYSLNSTGTQMITRNWVGSNLEVNRAICFTATVNHNVYVGKITAISDVIQSGIDMKSITIQLKVPATATDLTIDDNDRWWTIDINPDYIKESDAPPTPGGGGQGTDNIPSVYGYGHGEGFGTRSLGFAAHSEGYLTTASGNYSHAGGFNTIANRNYMTAIGKYNALPTTDELFAIGDGDENIRHTVFSVKENMMIFDLKDKSKVDHITFDKFGISVTNNTDSSILDSDGFLLKTKDSSNNEIGVFITTESISYVVNGSLIAYKTWSQILGN